MLKRKVAKTIEDYLSGTQDRIMLVEGARQIGKSFIIREVGSRMFANFIEVDLAEDRNGARLFEGVRTTDELYLRLSIAFGDKLSGGKDTVLVFLDEIQEYPQLITLLKFLNQEGRYRFIASGSLLGVTLNNVVSIPVGSVKFLDMYPLDFEEFLWANGFNESAVGMIKAKMTVQESLDEALHNHLMGLWKKFLVVGGMPAAVNIFLETKNYAEVRSVQSDIMRLYKADASKYDSEHRLMISRIYGLIPSNMENKKKRLVAQEIEGKKGARFAKYFEEFEYLVSSGVALEVSAVSNPKFPLAESVKKNLLKLYLNDAGLLTASLYGPAIQSVLDDIPSINLGAVYETAIACQLKANGHSLFYYDNKKKGEVDFLINDYTTQSVLPVEVKSGRAYAIHSAISNLVGEAEYHIQAGIVLSNHREIRRSQDISHYPIYYSMFM